MPRLEKGEGILPYTFRKGTKNMAKRYIPIANHILMDSRLYPSTLRVLVAMHIFKSRKNHLSVTQERLAKAAHCTTKTVRQAIEQLQELGYLQVIRRWRYSAYLDRIIYASNGYMLRNIDTQKGYTLLPCGVVSAQITHCAFAVLCHGYRYSGREGRFYASLRHMAKKCLYSKSTVIRALEQLRRLQMVARLHCIKLNRSYACNSYYPTAMIWSRNWDSVAYKVDGGLIFTQLLFINKITEDSIKREIEYGVAEFDESYKKYPNERWWPLYYFDGTGVKVSADEEHILAS